MKDGDIGTILYFTVKDQDGDIVDLTTASTATLTFKLNDNATLTKNCTFHDRANGIIKYTLGDDILTEPGELQAEVCITWDASNVFFSDTIIENVTRRVS
jgi:hypothetical protein